MLESGGLTCVTSRPQAGALTLVQWRLSRKQLLRRLGKTMEDLTMPDHLSRVLNNKRFKQ